MKKAIFSLALLLVSAGLSAQTIKVSFAKGDVATYKMNLTGTVGVPMQGNQEVSSTTTLQLTVNDATADGYVVEQKVTEFEMKGDNEMTQQFCNPTFYNAMKETPAVLKLDKNGAVVDPVNSDAVLSSVAKQTLDQINSLYEKHPEMEQALPKNKALMAANEQLTKENILKFYKEYGIFQLNGKDLKDGVPEETKMMDMIKVKNNYTVTSTDGALAIRCDVASNMTDNDVKAMLVEQMKKSGLGEQAQSAIESGWSQMKAMGMTKMDISGASDYNYDAQGWLTKQTSDIKSKVMGAEIKLKTDTEKVK